MKTLLLVGFCALAVTIQAGTVDFDSISATCCWIDVTPGGARGPFLSFSGMTIDGGVVISNAGWLDAATTSPNLYATADYVLGLPGYITMVFGPDVLSVNFDIMNGSSAARLSATAYDSLSSPVTTGYLDLAGFGEAGYTGHLSLSGAGIARVVVTSDRSPGTVVFAVDTINFSSSAVPEPSTFTLSALLVAGGWFGLRRRARNP